jgi:hypothetical protein
MALIDSLMINLELDCDGRMKAKLRGMIEEIMRRVATARTITDDEQTIAMLITPFVEELISAIRAIRDSPEASLIIWDMISKD